MLSFANDTSPKTLSCRLNNGTFSCTFNKVPNVNSSQKWGTVNMGGSQIKCAKIKYFQCSQFRLIPLNKYKNCIPVVQRLCFYFIIGGKLRCSALNWYPICVNCLWVSPPMMWLSNDMKLNSQNSAHFPKIFQLKMFPNFLWGVNNHQKRPRSSKIVMQINDTRWHHDFSTFFTIS